MKALIPLLLAAAAVAAPSTTTADVLLIDAIGKEPSTSTSGLPRPTNGQSMETVRRKFGDPVQEMPAVGDPPITRWRYDGFTVYFEYQLVINSVVHR
jgi:hypothetical protein